MSDTFTIASSSATGGNFKIYRLVDGKSKLVDLTEDERKAYTPPPEGKYDLKITGIADTWKDPKKPEWLKRDEDGNIIGKDYTLMTSLEFEILNGKGKGKRFTSRIPCSVYDTSHLGKVWKAAGFTIANGAEYEIPKLLGKELSLFVERNPGTDRSGNPVNYANPTWSTAKPIGSADENEDGWPDE